MLHITFKLPVGPPASLFLSRGSCEYSSIVTFKVYSLAALVLIKNECSGKIKKEVLPRC